MKKLRVLDLFSGIGGFSLGLERTGGFETVAFCEIEDFPRRVLAKHWPNTPIHRDVRKLKGEDIGTVDVICGGYPCQPFSTAGQRRGQEDDRHLWPEFSRLVAELRPTWVIGENVAGHISMGLDDVLSDLEGQGYACRTFVIPACAVDAPHRRDRVWTVAHASQLQRYGSGTDCEPAARQVPELRKRGCQKSMADTICERRCGGNSCRKYAEDAWQPSRNSGRDRNRMVGWLPESRVGVLVDGLPKKLGRGELNDGLGGAKSSAESGKFEWESVRGLRKQASPSEASPRLQQANGSYDSMSDVPRPSGPCRWDAQSEVDEKLQAMWGDLYANAQPQAQPLWPGLPEGNGPDQRFETLAWGAEPRINRVGQGVTNRTQKLKALGNAVVPQIPEMIGHAILEAERMPA